MSTEELQDHPAMIPSTGLKFLDLPVEIRDMIFRYVLLTPTGDDILVLKTSCSSTRRVELHFASVEPRRGKGMDWELGTYHLTHAQMTWSFMICRALYREQMEMFYTKNTFVFGSFRDMGNFLRKIGSSRRKHIGSVVICDDTSYGSLDPCHQGQKKSTDPLITITAAKKAWTLLGESQHLKRLEIRFEEYVNAAFPDIRLDGGPRFPTKIEGFSGKVGTDRMTEEPRWEWYYTDVERFHNLPGIEVVKKFRGLQEVVVVERRTLSLLREENDDFVARFKAMLTSQKGPNVRTKAKKLTTVKPMPALEIPQLKEISTNVMRGSRKRPGAKLIPAQRYGIVDKLQKFEQGQEDGSLENLKQAHRSEYPIALWEERMYSPRKSRVLSANFYKTVMSVHEDEEKERGGNLTLGPRRIQEGKNWIGRFQRATDFRLQHKPLREPSVRDRGASDSVERILDASDDVGDDADGDWLIKNSRGRDWQADHHIVFEVYDVNNRFIREDPRNSWWNCNKPPPDGSYRSGRVFDCGLDVPDGFVSVGTSGL
ncbi:hypothetical protein MMC11_002401 [Xylographa trunciseda]|nr:hypothetical protein [Xylographa trunciseda]